MTPIRRVLKGVKWLIILFILFHLAVGFAPFIRLPDPTDETLSRAEAMADEMQQDIETPDRAAIIEGSQEALDERIRLIQQAREEIVIVTYECHDGESTRDILAAALDRASEGVKVRFLVDGIAGRLDHMAEALFKAAATHPNVEVRFYNLIAQLAPWRHMGRMHDKYIIVDDLAYILGGRNMFDKFLGSYPAHSRSLDREALVYNAAHGTADRTSSLFALRDYFETMWAGAHTFVHRARGRIREDARQAIYDGLSARLAGIRGKQPELFAPCDYGAVTLETGGIWLLSNPTGIYAKQPEVFAQLCALMDRAKTDVVIHSPYAVLNRYMRGRLADIAGKVPVTLMVNAVDNGANVVAGSDYLYHRGEVLSTGVELLEYAGGLSYHGKALAIDDDLSVIGSFNLDMRSAYVDTELMLVIRGEAVNARLRQNMAALHAVCRRVTDADTMVTPQGVAEPNLSPWKLVALRVMGALVQPFRNLL